MRFSFIWVTYESGEECRGHVIEDGQYAYATSMSWPDLSQRYIEQLSGQEKRLPEITELMINGRIIISTICMNISPGKPIRLIASLLDV